MNRIADRQRLAAIALAAFVVAAVYGCDGHLDFGVRAGSGGAGGSGGIAASGGQSGRGGSSPCARDSDCRLSSLHCDPGSLTCVACVYDTHCSDGGLTRCDLGLHRCVACLAADDCPAGQTCLAAHCVTTCIEGATPSPCAGGTVCHDGTCATCGDDNTSCVGNPTMPLCLSPPAICVACRTDGDCGGPSPRCDPVRYVCVQCTTAADCSDSTLCDPTTGGCASG